MTKNEEPSLLKEYLIKRASIDDGQKTERITISMTCEDLRKLDLISVLIKNVNPYHHITRSSIIRDCILLAWEHTGLEVKEMALENGNSEE